MKNFFFISTIFLFIGIINLRAQTSVSGGIYSNTTWTLAGSPYTVTSQITVFPGVILTIQPGVHVKFDDNTGMEVRGNLIAQGTITDSIIFTSSDAVPTAGVWNGLSISNTQGGQAHMRFIRMLFANTAMQNECCAGGGPMNIDRSSFLSNVAAISGYANWLTYIDSCSFTNNFICIAEADKWITHCIFKNNQYGIYGVGRVYVFNSQFCSNAIAVSGRWGVVENCTIMNNGVGIIGFNDYNDTISGCTIANNDTGMIVNDHYSTSVLSGNRICGNTYYNLINQTAFNISVANNCWCDTSTAYISSKIYDGYDNINYGLVNYSPISNCSSTLPSAPCSGTPVPIGMQEFPDESISVFPNPMYGSATFTTKTELHHATIIVSDVTGRIVQQINDQSGMSFTIMRCDMNAGIYIVRLVENNSQTYSFKLMVAE